MGCGGSKKDEQAKPAKSPSSGSNSSSEKSEKKSSTPTIPGGDKIVMGKYQMLMSKEDNMGEGTSSICRKGKTIADKKPVAIKVYKENSKSGKQNDVTLQKFTRQITVLQELQAPFVVPKDPTLWHERLNDVKPEHIFMVLLDYSKDKGGNPNPDPNDGILYVVTELAQYSLKDFISQRRTQNKPLSKQSIQNVTRAILMAMAGLHAKGFVHLDMKPENMMMFNSKLKVIDVDGCVQAGTVVSISDSSISFSPCYCAPEWARFLIKESTSTIAASPLLDAWSVGMTLCELINLDAVLKPMYANFLRNAHSHREAGFLFMEWLGGLKKAQLPNSIEKGDAQFLQVLNEGLLVCDVAKRKTCAQCLAFDYIPLPSKAAQNEPAIEGANEETVREHRIRPEDDDDRSPMFKGSLFKLNTKGDPKDPAAWLKRDMWLSRNHSLCYYSQKENKRLVLLEADVFMRVQIKPVTDKSRFCHEFVIHVKEEDAEEGSGLDMYLAAEDAASQQEWLEKLKMTKKLDLVVTMKLGAEMAEQKKAYVVYVKNRRQKIEEDAKAQFEPVFKGKLWKLKGEGDQNDDSHWFEREMWLAKNHSLVYYSVKEERNLVYYTGQDIARASIEKQPGLGIMKRGFSVQLAPANGVEFSPGYFGIKEDNEKYIDEWISKFKEFMNPA